MLQKPFVSRKNQTLPVKVEACLSTPSQPRFIFLQQSKKKSSFQKGNGAFSPEKLSGKNT